MPYVLMDIPRLTRVKRRLLAVAVVAIPDRSSQTDAVHTSMVLYWCDGEIVCNIFEGIWKNAANLCWT